MTTYEKLRMQKKKKRRMSREIEGAACLDGLCMYVTDRSGSPNGWWMGARALHTNQLYLVCLLYVSLANETASSSETEEGTPRGSGALCDYMTYTLTLHTLIPTSG